MTAYVSFLGVCQIRGGMKLKLRPKTRRSIPTRESMPLDAPLLPNETWSLDFAHDTLYIGRRFRTLKVLDEGVRELLDIEIDTSLTGEKADRVLERLKLWRGLPRAIRCDNGPELLSEVEIRYIQPGKPNQNAFIKRFNRTYRDEVLGARLFEDPDQVREISWEWMQSYNEKKPHDS